MAWHPLGWQPVGFSEIEPFPSALLKHKYPNIPNYGDLTKYDEWPIEPGTVNLIVGGTPCQAWSVAGKRMGLDDPRGRVALAYAGLIEKLRPRWIVWENVPGVYSAGKPGGSDFAAFVGTLVKLGYHIAYRTLNAEYFGVPQRRRRCILVGYLGDWRPAAAVLFEPESLRRDIKKGRKKGEGIASGPQGGPRPGVGYFDFQAIWAYGNDGAASTLMARDYKDAKDLVIQPVCATGETTHCLTSSYRGSEDGTGRGTPIVPYTASSFAQYAEGVGTIRAAGGDLGGGSETLITQPIPIQDGRDMEKHQNGLGIGNPGDPSYTIDTTGAQSAAIPYRKSKRASSDKDDETWVEADKANTINLFDLGDTRTTHAVVHCSDVAPTVTSSGPPFSRTGNERTEAEALVVQSQPVAFQPSNLMRRAGSDPSTEVFPTVKCDTGDQSPHVAYPVVPLDDMNLLSRLGKCGEEHSVQNFTPGQPCFTLKKGGGAHGVLTPMAVRRLTPEECEALQGFPKGYSRIPWKGKPESECPDGPRYKACGNSMAVPVMAWVGRRIAEVEKLLSEQPKP